MPSLFTVLYSLSPSRYSLAPHIYSSPRQPAPGLLLTTIRASPCCALAGGDRHPRSPSPQEGACPAHPDHCACPTGACLSLPLVQPANPATAAPSHVCKLSAAAAHHPEQPARPAFLSSSAGAAPPTRRRLRTDGRRGPGPCARLLLVAVAVLDVCTQCQTLLSSAPHASRHSFSLVDRAPATAPHPFRRHDDTKPCCFVRFLFAPCPSSETRRPAALSRCGAHSPSLCPASCIVPAPT